MSVSGGGCALSSRGPGLGFSPGPGKEPALLPWPPDSRIGRPPPRLHCQVFRTAPSNQGPRLSVGSRFLGSREATVHELGKRELLSHTCQERASALPQRGRTDALGRGRHGVPAGTSAGRCPVWKEATPLLPDIWR